MDRMIKLSDLKQVVAQAYNKFRDEQCGKADARFTDANADDFAITVTLADGVVVEAGNTAATFPLGDIAKLPVITTFFHRYHACCQCHTAGRRQRWEVQYHIVDAYRHGWLESCA